MTTKEQPLFIEILIEGKYILRFNRTWERKKGDYVYACAGTPTELARLQEDIDSAFEPNPT